ncbi:DUF4402 domain-containing protein [Sphingomonas crusticola]|uniref:DUF4402 domain-containing protein n=1 Tax=Sphingomonas crusticola TaxID=1697973 RepID=UPI0013C2AC36|nr:DUF4402 domain-containing protein [Sphingomonas crusticola]
MYAKIAIGALLVVTSAPALAQSTATANASSTTTILSPISLTKVLDMQFGKVVRPGNASSNTVLVSAAGGRTISGTGNGVLVGTAGQQAQFTVAGEGAASISVTVPGTFAMGPLTVTTTGTYPTAIGGTAGSPGTATINVGGSFPMTSATATGSYTGTLTVTAAYN